MKCKLFLLLGASLAIGQSLLAETTGLQVCQQGGEPMLYVLADRPTLKQIGDEMLLSDSNSSISLTEVTTFQFVDIASIDAITMPSLTFEGRVVIGKGLLPSQLCELYSVDGKLLFSDLTDNEGSIRIELPENVFSFILKSYQTTIKFTIK